MNNTEYNQEITFIKQELDGLRHTLGELLRDEESILTEIDTLIEYAGSRNDAFILHLLVKAYSQMAGVGAALAEASLDLNVLPIDFQEQKAS